MGLEVEVADASTSADEEWATGSEGCRTAAERE